MRFSVLVFAIIFLPGKSNGVNQDVKGIDSEQQYSLGRAHFEGRDGRRQDCAEAIKWWEVAAKNGHAGAMYDIGNVFLKPSKGCPIKQDYAKALNWYRRAANRGDARAMTSIGVMHEGGMGVKRDGREAVKWYFMAANRGDDQAKINLGSSYSSGRFVERDYAKAMEWYMSAWRSMSASLAGALIGDMYRDGLGVAKNPEEAERWYKISGAPGEARLKGLPPCSKADIGQPCAP